MTPNATFVVRLHRDEAGTLHIVIERVTTGAKRTAASYAVIGEVIAAMLESDRSGKPGETRP